MIDDAPPVVEGGTAEFVVRLSAVSGVAVTVDFETVDGTAKAGSDYTAASGTLTFTAGQLVQTISVATLDDTVPEAEEGFTVVLSNPEGAGLGERHRGGDDHRQRPAAGTGDRRRAAGGGRGHGGVRGAFERGERRGGDGGLRDGGRDGAGRFGLHGGLGDADLHGGETAKTISVATLDDTVPEAEEGFTVVLSNPEGAGLEDDTGEGTITDDDQPPGLVIDDAPPVVEGGTAEFVVRLSAVSGVAVTVDFETADDTAVAGSTITPRDRGH